MLILKLMTEKPNYEENQLVIAKKEKRNVLPQKLDIYQDSRDTDISLDFFILHYIFQKKKKCKFSHEPPIQSDPYYNIKVLRIYLQNVLKLHMIE